MAATDSPTFLHSGWQDEYWNKGYVILRGVFRHDELAELRIAFDRTYAEAMQHPKTWRHQNRTIWVHQSAAIGQFISGCQWQSWVDPVLDRVRTDPRMLAIVEPLIGNHLKQIINQMHWKMPHSGYTWCLHQDVRSRKPDHCFRELGRSYVQTGIAIDRHWADNGAMKILPYSHLRGDLRMESGLGPRSDTREEAVATAGFDPQQLVDVVLEPGDVALWTPYTIHGGGVNTTADDQRRFYINGYVKAENCDRGQPVFHHGRPVPLTIPALIQYDDLYVRPEPHYPEDKASLQPRD